MTKTERPQGIGRRLPFGTVELEPRLEVRAGPPRLVRCYVRGCHRWLRPAASLCPEHGIRCHHSIGGATYAYADVGANAVVAPELLRNRIVGHPFKYDSRRMGNERSEDALTWNVFRSFQEAGCLHVLANLITGLHRREEPRLFLWGIELTGDRCQPWDLLIAARERFERRLPVKRPKTEPDIVLFLAGVYLILIEAKFTSVNPWYVCGRRRDAESLTKCELLQIYQDPALRILDIERACAAEHVYYQLWRNLVFAEWMARLDGSSTVAHLANLTRAEFEAGSTAAFRQVVRPEYARRFTHLTWEDLARTLIPGRPELSRLGQYLATKTAGLRPAFRPIAVA